MKIASFDCDCSSFIYYSFHVKDDETGQYLYEEELVDPDLNSIAQGIITLLNKSVELGATVDAIVYEHLEQIVDEIAKELNLNRPTPITAKDMNITVVDSNGKDISHLVSYESVIMNWAVGDVVDDAATDIG